MARYVKEFAKACTLSEKRYGKHCSWVKEMNKKIMHVVKIYEKGLITDFEAVKSIVEIKAEGERNKYEKSVQ